MKQGTIVLVAIFASIISLRMEPGTLPGFILLHKESNAAAVTVQSGGMQESDSDTSIANNTSIGSNLSPQEMRQLINLHAKVRADVGVSPLKWSGKLAIYAQRWADHLAYMDCKMKHRPHSGKWKKEHGENLFTGTAGYYGVADAVAAWESENKYYKGDALNSSNWYDSGHYTQVVWKNSQRIGCAKAECSNGRIIVVCNYDPPGNVIGQKPY